MLSRIAESLFWIGRYVERAEHTARILEVQLRHFVEEPTVPTALACANMLTLMGVPPATYEPLLDPDDPQGDHRALMRTLAYDREQPTSIAYCWVQARDNARRAREVIPSSVWEVVNTTWQALPTGYADVMHQHGYLSWAREQATLFYGTARELMMRDEGWQFLQLGRSLEQADMTARLLTSTTFAQGAVPWASVLRGCDAHDAFLRTNRGWREHWLAAQFLIQEHDFPRSLLHGLSRAAGALEAVSPDAHGVGRPGEARYELGRLTQSLAYTPPDELLDDLAGLMAEVQRTCQQVTTAITQQFFATAEEQAWSTEETH